MKTSATVISTALFASGALGTYILATDNFLRFASPTHYEGLAVFVLIDAALIVALWRQTRFATLGAMLAATVQLVAMLGDIVGGQPVGVSSAAFATYLLTDTTFVSLLVVQGIIIALATETMALPLVHHVGTSRVGKS